MAAKSDDVKIKFTADYTVQDEHENDAKKSRQYVKGKTYGMSQASALHFMRKGVAEAVAAPAAKKG